MNYFKRFISSHKFKKCHLILVAEHWQRVKTHYLTVIVSLFNSHPRIWLLYPISVPKKIKAVWPALQSSERRHDLLFSTRANINYAERLSSLPQMQGRGLFAIVAYAGRRLTPQVRWDRQSRRFSNFWGRIPIIGRNNNSLSNMKKAETLNLVK